MKKIIYILICLLLNLSVFAATLSEKFNSFLDPIENFNKKEHIIYKDSFDKTNEEFKSIWNLNSKRLPKFKKDSSEINIETSHLLSYSAPQILWLWFPLHSVQFSHSVLSDSS